MTNNELIKKYIPENKQEEAYKRLNNGEPIQYIIGNVEFYNSIINVDKRVLIPRFETENLVAKTVYYAKKMFNKKIKIVDLGTGSGCIAIALKKALDSVVVAIDISSDALDLAKKNAELNQVDITFLKENIDNPLKGKFDIIISNPPYIPSDGYVEDIVKDNEPHLALFATDNGLYHYKKILSYALEHINTPGLIAFEIGDKQFNLLEQYIKENFPLVKYEFQKDLADNYRYLFIFVE